MKRAIEYEAEDGERFKTAEDCKQHDRTLLLQRLVDMTFEEVTGAIERIDVRTADAIEFAGNLIAEKRRSMGGSKRKKKTDAEKLAEVGADVQAKKANK